MSGKNQPSKSDQREEMLSMDEVFLNRLHRILENNLKNPEFSVEDLGKEIGLSRSQIHRRLQQINGQSASRFIRSYKLKRAREYLKKNVGNVSQIAYWVGFSSPAYFGKVYLEEYGYPPSEERKAKELLPKESSEKQEPELVASNTIGNRPIPIYRIYLISMVLAVITAAWWIWSNFMKKTDLTTSLSNARIAILPYDNKTNDPDLDVLGNMAADWMIEGLMNFESLRLVSFQNTMDHISLASAGNWVNFARQTGAEKVLKGSFYKLNNQLTFQTQIIDIETGNIEFVLPEIAGSTDDLEQIIQTLRQRMMGLIAADNEEMIFIGPNFKTNPPTFEAYEMYKKANQYWLVNYPEMGRLAREAIKLDSTFYWPYVFNVFSYANTFEYAKADSALRLIDHNFDQLTPYQQLWYDYMDRIVDGDLPEAAIAIKKIYEKDPKNLIIGLALCQILSQNNKITEAVDLGNRINFTTLKINRAEDVAFYADHGYWRLFLNRPKEAVSVMNQLPEDVEYYRYWKPFYRSMAHAFLEQHDSVSYVLSTMEQDGFKPMEIIRTHYLTSYYYSLLGQREYQLKLAYSALQLIKDHEKFETIGSIIKSDIHFLAENYAEALPAYEEWALKDVSINFLLSAKAGVVEARLGLPERAKARISQLKLTDSPIKHGGHKYAIACIYAALNEKALAVDYLQQAFQEGFFFGPRRYYSDHLLNPLHGYPPYEQFVKYCHHKSHQLQ